MKRKTLLLLAVIVLLWAWLPTAAQSFLPKTIQFKGSPEYSDQELLAAVGLKKGAPIAYSDVKGYSQKLLDTGLFDSAKFTFDGIDLVFTLVPSTLHPMRLINLPLNPGTELDAELHDRVPLYHGKVPSEGSLTEQVRSALETMLAAKGIKAAVTVMADLAEKQHQGTVMSYDITTPQVRVGAIHLEGVSAALQTQVQHLAEHITGSAFDTENSAGNLEQAISLLYADEGYAAVKVHAARSGDAVVTAAAIDIPLSATVEEGRQYKLGFIRVLPDSPVAQAEIDHAVVSHTAMGQTIRDTLFMIASRCKSKGYLNCKVTPHPVMDDASATVNYTIEIDSGPVFHFASVRFENVTEGLRNRLMRVWQMLPGDPFDESQLPGFLARAQKQDPVLMQSLAGVGASYKDYADEQTHEVNCVIRFTKLQ
jgi:outer membrane protein assembly factor BamA